MWIIIIPLLVGVLLGIILVRTWDEISTRRSIKKQERIEKKWAEKHQRKIDNKRNKDLDGWLSWTVSGDVTLDEMRKVLSKIYTEDWENLAFFADFMKIQFDVADLDDCVYLHHIGKTLWNDIELYVAIKPEFIPEEKNRIKAARELENKMQEYIHNTYGDVGEEDLKLYFSFCELEREGCVEK